MWAVMAVLALGCHTSPVLMPKAEARPPAYSSQPGVTGRLELGADPDTRALAEAWGLAFRKIQHEVTITWVKPSDGMESQAFLKGESRLTLLARRLSAEEVEKFQQRAGHPPQRILVALEPIVLLVNAQNPLVSLTLEQLDALYSSNRRYSLTHAPDRWWDLGLEGEWANQKITLLAPGVDSTRCVAFRDLVLLKAGLREGVIQYPDLHAMQGALAADPGGIAFGSLQDLSPRVKVIPLVIPGSPVPVLPDAESIRAGRYPLIRYLYLYADTAPGSPLPAATAEFVRFILSKEGQGLLPGHGLVPVPADVAKRGLSRLVPS